MNKQEYLSSLYKTFREDPKSDKLSSFELMVLNRIVEVENAQVAIDKERVEANNKLNELVGNLNILIGKKDALSDLLWENYSLTLKNKD